MHANRLTLNRVREIRRKRSLTQSQLARKAQVALRTIQSVERGLGCRRDTMRKLLRGLDIPFGSWREVFLMTPIPSPPLEIETPMVVSLETWHDLGVGQESYLDTGA